MFNESRFINFQFGRDLEAGRPDESEQVSQSPEAEENAYVEGGSAYEDLIEAEQTEQQDQADLPENEESESYPTPQERVRGLARNPERLNPVRARTVEDQNLEDTPTQENTPEAEAPIEPEQASQPTEVETTADTQLTPEERQEMFAEVPLGQTAPLIRSIRSPRGASENSSTQQAAEAPIQPEQASQPTEVETTADSQLTEEEIQEMIAGTPFGQFADQIESLRTPRITQEELDMQRAMGAGEEPEQSDDSTTDSGPTEVAGL